MQVRATVAEHVQNEPLTLDLEPQRILPVIDERLSADCGDLLLKLASGGLHVERQRLRTEDGLLLQERRLRESDVSVDARRGDIHAHRVPKLLLDGIDVPRAEV